MDFSDLSIGVASPSERFDEMSEAEWLMEQEVRHRRVSVSSSSSSSQPLSVIDRFQKLLEEGLDVKRERIIQLTEKVMAFFGYELAGRTDTPIQQAMSFVKRAGRGGPRLLERHVTFQMEKKTEQVALSMQLIPMSGAQNSPQLTRMTFGLDVIANSMHADMLGSVSNVLSVRIPALSIEHVKQTKQLKCVSSMVGQLDENFVNWLLLNIDLLLMVNIFLLALFDDFTMSQNESDSSFHLIDSALHTINSRISENKHLYKQLLITISAKDKKQTQ